MTENSRSPIKDKPLRLPGQSLAEERDRLFEDKFLPVFFLALFLVLMAGLEWWRYLVPQRPQPLVMSIAALLAIGFATWRFATLWPRVRELRLGIEGERAVGQQLEGLRKNGYEVLHDLVGEGFNVDHVVIGPAGVFTIETKTRSKPARGDAVIDFDGERVLVAGHEPERDPVVQAKAQARWLRQLIEESTGKRKPIRPVVVFPGWFVRQTQGSTREVWVLEPKALPGFLGHEAVRLNPEDIRLVGYHLSRLVRSSHSQT